VRRRFARHFRGRRKRSCTWLAGVTTYDPVAGGSSRLTALTQAGFTTANVWGAVISPVAAIDLPLHGGEDAVLTRLVGRFGFMEGRKDAGAGLAAFGFQMRVAFQLGRQQQGTATVLADELVTSAGMGSEDILWFRDVIVPAQTINAAGSGFDVAFTSGPFWQAEFDIKVKRKIHEDTPVLLWFQTVLPPGTTGADFRLFGGVRSLLMRPA